MGYRGHSPRISFAYSNIMRRNCATGSLASLTDVTNVHRKWRQRNFKQLHFREFAEPNPFITLRMRHSQSISSSLDSHLPEWLPEITLEDLRIGDSVVSICFQRDKHGESDYRILDQRGPLHVLRQPSPLVADCRLWRTSEGYSNESDTRAMSEAKMDLPGPVRSSSESVLLN